MAKMHKIDKSCLGNDKHFLFHTEFRNLVIKEGAANLNIEPIFNSYLPLYDREKVLVKGRFDEVVVKSARLELDAAYDVICWRLNAYAIIGGGERYERFVKTFNSVISKYNVIINPKPVGLRSRMAHKPAFTRVALKSIKIFIRRITRRKFLLKRRM